MHTDEEQVEPVDETKLALLVKSDNTKIVGVDVKFRPANFISADVFIDSSADELTAAIESFMNKLSISVTLMNVLLNINSLLPLIIFNVLSAVAADVNISAFVLLKNVLFENILLTAEVNVIVIPVKLLFDIIFSDTLLLAERVPNFIPLLL